MPTPFLPGVAPVYQSLKPVSLTSFAFWPFHLVSWTHRIFTHLLIAASTSSRNLPVRGPTFQLPIRILVGSASFLTLILVQPFLTTNLIQSLRLVYTTIIAILSSSRYVCYHRMEFVCANYCMSIDWIPKLSWQNVFIFVILFNYLKWSFCPYLTHRWLKTHAENEE